MKYVLPKASGVVCTVLAILGISALGLLRLLNSSGQVTRGTQSKQGVSSLPGTSARKSDDNFVPPQSKARVQFRTPAYDETRTFEENLKELMTLCQSHSDDPQLEGFLNSLVKGLLQHSRDQLYVVSTALKQPGGTAAFRNILLACLMASEATTLQKADVAWSVALNRQELVSVRRTASYLTSRLEDGTSRPNEYYTLLTDTDSQVIASALASPARHMDQLVYDLIRNNLLKSLDVHVRLAAVNAIGHAPFADNQTALIDIVDNTPTSKATAFSEASLVKRTAILYLDMQSPETYGLVRQVALDDDEDPGVRAKAISRFKPSDFPEASPMLLHLLASLDANNTVPLRATVDTLLTDPKPATVEAIRSRVGKVSDPQVRELLLSRITMAPQGG